MQSIIRRAQRKTPPFFKKLRNIGLAITTVSAAILTVPVVLPVAVVAAAGYLAAAGAAVTGISQLTVTDERSPQHRPQKKGGKHVPAAGT